MGKRDKTLVAVTIILLLALVFSFVWDIDKFVLKRTVDIELSDTMEIETMHKYGPMIYRKAYECKIRINPDEAEKIFTMLADYSHVIPEILSSTEFVAKSEELFNSQNLKPTPLDGSDVGIVKTITADGDYATYMVSFESETAAYVYIYFSRG